MALPQNVAQSTRRGWRSADLMWRLAGDTATDYNHYTKRAILASIYAATVAVFVDEGRVADVFGPGTHRLTTSTLPVLTNLKNWDKLFESPFKSDVYFFSTRQQVDRRWGTPQPITIRDKDFGAVRLRAFGNYSYRIVDPKRFHTEISGTRDLYTVADLDGQLRGLMLQHISDAVASSGVAFLDLAANQIEFANALQKELIPAFEAIGCEVDPVHRHADMAAASSTGPTTHMYIERLFE